nr:hypothetical protein [Tanacetum cinerariifolium]
MSSDNAPFAVTYMSISFDLDGPSWGIPLMNAGELPETDPYEEVSQQGQAPPLSPAYVPDPMELDEHVPVYVPEPDHPKYHEDFIDYPDEPEDDDEDPKEDPEEGHTDYPTDGGDGDDEPSDDDYDDDTDDEDEETTEDKDDNEEEEHLAPADSSAVPVVDSVPSAEDAEAFETDESAPTPRSPQTRISFSQTRLCRARKTVRLEPPMTAMIRIRDDILKEVVLTAPLPGCNVEESCVVDVARPPRGQYDFVDTVEAGQGLIRSPGHDAQTIARAADRVEDVGYVRALQASEHRMMTSIEEFNLRISYQAQVRRQESEDFYTQLHDV